MIQADEFTKRFGEGALREAETLLDVATAGRDHRAGIFYADVCNELRDRESRPCARTVDWVKLLEQFQLHRFLRKGPGRSRFNLSATDKSADA
jgi:hypothetical protein